MTGDTSAVRRRRWHPLAGGLGITAVAFGVAGAGLLAAAAGRVAWPLLGAWLLTGAAAGFATSGST